MSTRDAVGGAPQAGLGSALSAADLANLAGEVARVANELFSGTPPAAVPPASLATPGVGALSSPAPPPLPVAGPSPVPGPLPPPRLGPSASNVGGGGMSAAQTQPPMPGFLHTPSLAASPLPKEADVRPAPTLLAELFGTPTPLELMLSADSRTPSATPYFLEHAGVPQASAPVPALPFLDAPPMPDALPTDGAPSVSSLPSPYLPTTGSLPVPGSVPSGALSEGLPSASSQWAPDLTRIANDPGPAVPGLGAPALPERASPVFESPSVPAPVTGGTPSDGFSPELVPELGVSPGIFNAAAIRKDFPILEERVHGNKRLIWLDNAATTQKPNAVIERVSYFYEHENSNIHRAAHTLAARATDAYEGARERVRRFLNAPTVKDIVFTRGATEAINLVAQSWGRRNVKAGDEIVLTVLEHHANIVPWQQLAVEKGAKIRVAPVDSSGQIILEEYEKLFNPRTRIAAFTQVSNALGTVTPAREMVEIAHRHGARALVDGAQTVSHQSVDVQTLDCDFYCFSGHKVFGPTGIGALYGKTEVLEHMPPWQGGGNMIADVTFETTRYQAPPFRFEAGTGNIADAVGLGAAIDYVTGIGLENVAGYEHELLVYATEGLCQVPGLTVIGTAPEKAGVLSFILDGMRTEDVGAALDKEGIAVRSGHHCAQPILRRFGLEATVRASLAPYNTHEDIDALVAAVARLQTGRPRL
ncbi:MAG TPA: family 2A encapsulin nanocompartment cargo protein cysteine desulfurase [Polyangiaceae bacterium]|nr:family 2A encapsulin nanocompartment cargo protein cysteine desulfurase [Polyangiaceae bacterium]